MSHHGRKDKHKHRKIRNDSISRRLQGQHRNSYIITALCALLGLAAIVYLVLSGAHFGGNM